MCIRDRANHTAVIDDAGALLYTGYGAPSMVNQQSMSVLMRNDSVLVQEGVTSIFGHAWRMVWSLQWTPLNGFSLESLWVSPNRRYALMRLSRLLEPYALTLVDLESGPLPCGSFTDRYEPNGGCAAATPVTFSTDDEAGLGLARATRGMDEDWYEIPASPGTVTRVRALHLARDTEVDFEVFGGGFATILQGSTWSFQYWYQDANPMPTSNFSGVVEVVF